jgi:mono/diheme cytochrome c family protein
MRQDTTPQFTLPVSPAVAVLVLALAGCGETDEHDHPGLTTGAQFYEYHCSACHKMTGQGTFLAGIPALTSTDLAGADIVALIRGHGRADTTKMPSFDDMPDAEAQAIAAYVLEHLKTKGKP